MLNKPKPIDPDIITDWRYLMKKLLYLFILLASFAIGWWAQDFEIDIRIKRTILNLSVSAMYISGFCLFCKR